MARHGKGQSYLVPNASQTEGMPMPYFDCDETDRAADLYFKWVARAGLVANQPNRQLSERVGDKVYLRNIQGDLARFRVLPDGRMRRIWPR